MEDQLDDDEAAQFIALALSPSARLVNGVLAATFHMMLGMPALLFALMIMISLSRRGFPFLAAVVVH